MIATLVCLLIFLFIYIKLHLIALNRFSKWQKPTQNVQVGDIACLRDEPTIPTKWPLARIAKVHPGQDGKIRVVTLHTPKGLYKIPIVKIVPILRPDHSV